MMPSAVPNDRSLQILVVGSYRGLEDEFKSAFAGIPDRRGVIHFASSYRQGLDVARDRHPRFVVAAIEHDVRALARFSKDLH